jgi:hypothetical protein
LVVVALRVATREFVAVRGKTVVPGRVDVVVRVAVLRPLSVLERTTVVETLDCVAPEFALVRPDVATPSRTAACAVAPSENARIVPKIRIFFISGENCSKIYKTWARKK